MFFNEEVGDKVKATLTSAVDAALAIVGLAEKVALELNPLAQCLNCFMIYTNVKSDLTKNRFLYLTFMTTLVHLI